MTYIEIVDGLDKLYDSVQGKIDVYLSHNEEVINNDEESDFNYYYHNILPNMSKYIDIYIIKYQRYVQMGGKQSK